MQSGVPEGGQRGDLQAKKMKKSYRGKICMDFDQTFTGHNLGVPSPYHSLFWTLNQTKGIISFFLWKNEKFITDKILQIYRWYMTWVLIWWLSPPSPYQPSPFPQPYTHHLPNPTHTPIPPDIFLFYFILVDLCLQYWTCAKATSQLGSLHTLASSGDWTPDLRSWSLQVGALTIGSWT